MSEERAEGRDDEIEVRDDEVDEVVMMLPCEVGWVASPKSLILHVALVGTTQKVTFERRFDAETGEWGWHWGMWRWVGDFQPLLSGELTNALDAFVLRSSISPLAANYGISGLVDAPPDHRPFYIRLREATLNALAWRDLTDPVELGRALGVTWPTADDILKSLRSQLPDAYELDRNIDLIRKLNLPIRIEVHENF